MTDSPGAGSETALPDEPPPPTPCPARARRRSIALPSTRAIQWLIAVLLVAGGVSFIVKGADRPRDPYLVATREPIAGFGEIAYRVSRTPARTRCAMLAQSVRQQEQGLMNQTSLHGYDGMLFVFSADTTVGFYMKDTPMPLSIAWFDTGGRFVGSAEMEPCLDKPGPQCPVFTSPEAYRYALEVAKGGLGPLGIGPGAVISVGGPCA
jgi:uncharacterized membrane protein (UPF0127 family)